MQDGIIKDAVMAALMEAEVSDVQVDVREGIAVVQGVVDVLNDRETVERVIKKVPGVVNVENNLTIATEKAVENREIENAIREKYRGSEELERLTVTCSKGIVAIQGEVGNLNTKRNATKLAGEIQGVKEIINRLKIKSPARGDDASITNAVEAAFAADEKIDSGTIKTTTKDGRVTLEGDVSNSSQKLWAEQLAATVPGVRKVINKLTSRSGKDADRNQKLTNRLRKALEAHPRIGEGQLLTYVIGRTAYLAGEVFTPDAKSAAESIAKNMEGIHEVSSNIEIVTH